jgi:hypothetical protein
MLKFFFPTFQCLTNFQNLYKIVDQFYLHCYNTPPKLSTSTYDVTSLRTFRNTKYLKAYMDISSRLSQNSVCN